MRCSLMTGEDGRRYPGLTGRLSVFPPLHHLLKQEENADRRREPLSKAIRHRREAGAIIARVIVVGMV